MGHLHPQHLEDGEQILVCNRGNRAQNKPTNSPQVLIFFPSSCQNSRTLFYPLSVNISHAPALCFDILWRQYTCSSGTSGTKPNIVQEKARHESQHKRCGFFRDALIKVSFTKPIKRLNKPTHSALLKHMMDRIYRTNIQTTNLHRKLVDPSMVWIKLYS